ncbi:MAG: hypothetical protein CMC13_13080 [Flavobacteriaceae bacterium]|nr:hypothetical protein [Flavobacteriaceae bacterium]|tara:strand:- start:872 stop:1945 length:1074 start_codon:yes stop_codon:yes gene_type:complete
MKIIRLSTFLDYGGIETKMVNLSSLKDGNTWIFCAIGKGGKASKAIMNNNRKVKTLNLNHKIPNFFTIITLYKFFKKERPHVLHTSGAEANFHGIIAAWFARCPVIVAEEIGIPSQSKMAIIIFKWLYGMADFVVGESKAVVDNLMEKYSINRNKVKVISNFLVVPKYVVIEEKNNSTSLPFTICAISRLETVKNIEGVLVALAKLKKRGYIFRFLIAGNGSKEMSLKELVLTLKLTDEVQFLGYVENPYAILNKADLYILNSFSEGFSNSLLEAMYSKTPVISTNVGAATEFIDHGKNGWIVPVNSNIKLAQQIEEIMIISASRRQVIGYNGYNTVIENYTLEQHLEKLLSIYNKS